MPGFELFGDAERKEVNEVLDSGVLMRYGFDGARNDWKAVKLEKLLAERMQTQYAQLVSSGTAALSVALVSAGVGAGDEVIIPTFTFVATFEAVLAVGAIPVLVDVDETLGLNPKAVRNAITERTKAIMPVHMCGSMVDLDPLVVLCKKYSLVLIEDACQAIGGSYNNKPLGSIGDIGCFSFDYVKTITCGEGGGLITNNKDYYRHADHYSDHGHDHIGKDRGAEGHPFLGYNYRISELHAAVGVAQIQRLDEFLATQKKYYLILEEALKTIPEVTFRKIPEGGVQNYSFISFFLPTETEAKAAHTSLGQHGVDASFYWFDNNWHYHTKWEHLKELKSLNQFSDSIEKAVFSSEEKDFSASDQVISRTISCLIKLSWTEAQVHARAKAMVAAINVVLG
ncbi:Glutamine--scyllo-inositol transaminase [Cellulophaga algicola DSM 14237]|uniref:Glutamine--scyllo-inositol transaminase n=1 Tax=Cellulophaga algicola (strain DSM 14237 / IC166 / ACAM 630) TaxID=688270 RepID=E6X964_CELAD|nr:MULTISPECIES: DegT/DnrJ/EryC1/StrS family aminotransferase [Cellulophaga]ADV50874.1 Glutamine--scyllo-inositol transaminase [Cellulophaga algicola DSM 14237]